MSGAPKSNVNRLEGASQTATKKKMEEKDIEFVHFFRTNLERKRKGNGSSLKDKCDYRKVLYFF